jgi:hypothetical protein
MSGSDKNDHVNQQDPTVGTGPMWYYVSGFILFLLIAGIGVYANIIQSQHPSSQQPSGWFTLVEVYFPVCGGLFAIAFAGLLFGALKAKLTGTLPKEQTTAATQTESKRMPSEQQTSSQTQTRSSETRAQAQKVQKEKNEQEQAQKAKEEQARKTEAERIARERAQRAEAIRLAHEEAKRVEAEQQLAYFKAEAERLAREKAEAERLAREQAKSEQSSRATQSPPMRDAARESLRQLVMEYGRSICEDPMRCRSLLLDVCGEYRREINVLMAVLEEHVVADLLAPPASVPGDLFLARLTRRVCENRGLAQEVARWGVQAWVFALGL